MRNDNLTNYAYVGNGAGTSPPELYLAYHADDLADDSLIQPGQTTKLQNEQVRALRHGRPAWAGDGHPLCALCGPLWSECGCAAPTTEVQVLNTAAHGVMLGNNWLLACCLPLAAWLQPALALCVPDTRLARVLPVLLVRRLVIGAGCCRYPATAARLA